jgi:imidazolonepropionase-like amidohydrolase
MERKRFSTRVLGLALLCLSGSAQLFAQTPNKIALVGGRLLDGYETPPLERSVVIVEGNRIVEVGRVGEVKIPSDAKVISTDGMTVMPGLIDMHVHLEILGHGDYAKWDPKYKNRMPEVFKLSARQLLMAGVTTARDLGGPLEQSITFRDAINRGEAEGPRMFVTGPFITRELMAGENGEAFDARVIHSSAEARAVAKEFLAAGVDGLKGWYGLTEDDLRALVEEAHAKHKWVASHIDSDSRFWADIRAGVDTLEHLCGKNQPLCPEEEVKALSGGNFWLVPTLIYRKVYDLTEAFPGRLDNPRLKAALPPDIYADVRGSADHFQRLWYFADFPWQNQYIPDKFRQLVRADVRLLIGTDSGTPLNYHFESTRNEMKLWTEYGVPPLRVIGAATRLPAIALGLGNQLGTIEPGKLADIIVVDGDPLADMNALREVIHVIKEGKIYK